MRPRLPARQVPSDGRVAVRGGCKRGAGPCLLAAYGSGTRMARGCSMLAVADHRALMENPSTATVDAVLAHMEATYGEN